MHGGGDPRAAVGDVMFDLAWSEIALIGVVALVVIGPKDLPEAIRGLARGVQKLRRMASEFQGQADELVREANLDEVRHSINEIRNFNIRDTLEKAVDTDGTIRKTFTEDPLKTDYTSAYTPPLAAARWRGPRAGRQRKVIEPPAAATPAFIPPAYAPPRPRPRPSPPAPAAAAEPPAPPPSCRPPAAAESRPRGRAGADPEELSTDTRAARTGRHHRRQADAAARPPDGAAHAAALGGRRLRHRLRRLLLLLRPDLRLPGPAAGRHPAAAGRRRAADDLHRAVRGLLHLPEGGLLRRGVLQLPGLGDAALAVRGARPVPQREAGDPALPGRHAVPVRAGRGAGLLLHLPAGLALLHHLRDAAGGRARCRSSSRPRSANISRWSCR